jgi:hypothetical protein
LNIAITESAAHPQHRAGGSVKAIIPGMVQQTDNPEKTGKHGPGKFQGRGAKP